MSLEIARDAVARDAPNLGSHLLNHHHQRKAQDECPREPVTELGADLAVSADAARVIVCCPGYETGTERPNERSKTVLSCLPLLHRCHLSNTGRPIPAGQPRLKLVARRQARPRWSNSGGQLHRW